ncbi:hypothetical protein P7D22_19725 [Lichenihabitans sp. Uapishka_5]|uniref:hypothetical protein n=1 Tax=Lichenihabitans sp. Uapishka_5 TaxID=3037302 RepID=UPI0029E8268E|nr:hypothetical protein [Lichenihabitans sp. Uapishka_5]MDX7953398.1 hypothetical protein [Lichenihabitans sp. Uapishka_5]
MAKRSLPSRIVMPIAEPIAPKDLQLAALRTRIRCSDALLSVVADLAFGSGWADRSSMMEAR